MRLAVEILMDCPYRKAVMPTEHLSDSAPEGKKTAETVQPVLTSTGFSDR